MIILRSPVEVITSQGQSYDSGQWRSMAKMRLFNRRLPSFCNSQSRNCAGTPSPSFKREQGQACASPSPVLRAWNGLHQHRSDTETPNLVKVEGGLPPFVPWSVRNSVNQFHRNVRNILPVLIWQNEQWKA